MTVTHTHRQTDTHTDRHTDRSGYRVAPQLKSGIVIEMHHILGQVWMATSYRNARAKPAVMQCKQMLQFINFTTEII